MPRPNPGPHLKLNSDGVWEIRWTEDGRSRRRSTGERDTSRAQAVFSEFLVLQRRGSEGESLPVSSLLAHYSQGHVDRRVASKLTSELAVGHLVAFFGDSDVSGLGPREIEDYELARGAGTVGWEDGGVQRGFRKAGSSSVRRELAVLVAAINYGVRSRILSRVDAPEITLPKSSQPRDRWLTRTEAKLLLDTAAARSRGAGVAQGARQRMSRGERFIYLGLYTAGRKEAIETLQWSTQVSLDRGLIDLNPPGREQTKKRRPIIPIAAPLRPILQRMYDERTSDFLLDHGGDIRTTFERTVAAAGLKRVSPHTLRHTAATWMVQAGVSFERVARFLGTTVAMIERVYGHHAPDFLQDAADGLGALDENVDLLS